MIFSNALRWSADSLSASSSVLTKIGVQHIRLARPGEFHPHPAPRLVFEAGRTEFGSRRAVVEPVAAINVADEQAASHHARAKNHNRGQDDFPGIHGA